MTVIITEPQSYASLSGLPRIDIPDNLNLALASGRSVASLLWEIISLWRGPGKLSPQEYFYYRLWDPSIPVAEKRRFVGKKAQHEMHMACNSQYWYGAAADKILFYTIMKGACLPVPDLIAIAAAGRSVPGIPNLVKSGSMAAMLRRPELYPLFMKEVAGKFSLSVISADAYDVRHDEVVLLDGTRQSPDALATTLTSPNGYLVQRRLRQAPALADLFGPRLWSVRLLVFHGATGPVIHRAVTKIATGTNAADNYWRPGNMLGAIDLQTGVIFRAVCGTGVGLEINGNHPDTGHSIVGTLIPTWDRIQALVVAAASVFAGIRTQSWDIALADNEPVFLEVNFGGDLNLAQLADNAGVSETAYAKHLEACAYSIDGAPG
jgi:hypothetical protein